jgi:hypothetical protein
MELKVADIIYSFVIFGVAIYIIYTLYFLKFYIFRQMNEFSIALVAVIISLLLQVGLRWGDLGFYENVVLSACVEEIVKVGIVLLAFDNKLQRHKIIKICLYFGFIETLLKLSNILGVETVFQVASLVSLCLPSIVMHVAYGIIVVRFRNFWIGISVACVCHAAHNTVVFAIARANVSDEGIFFAIYMIFVLAILVRFVSPQLQKLNLAKREKMGGE